MLLIVLGLLVGSPWTGLWSRYGEWIGSPSVLQLVGIGAFVAIAASADGRPRWPLRIAAAGCMAVVWSTHRVLSMGDGHLWREWTGDGSACVSEPLSSLLHGLTHRHLGAEAIEWLSVVAGVLATLAWLHIVDRLIDRQPQANDHSEASQATRAGVRTARTVGALLWASSGICSVFFYRYVEHTQLGIAPMLLGVGALVIWSRDIGSQRQRRRDLLIGFAMLALATLTHLQNVGLLIAAAFAVFLLECRRIGWQRTLFDFALSGALVAAIIGSGIVVMRCSSFEWIPGTIAGGADNSYWMRLTDDNGAWFVTGTLLSRDHLALVTHILLFAAPALSIALVAIAWRSLRGGGTTVPAVALATTGAYCVFASCFGFDLGWPTDLDLMIAMSPVCNVLVATLLLPGIVSWRPATRIACVALLVGLTVWTWSIIGPLTRARWLDLSQRNSAGATLIVNGVGARDGNVGGATTTAPYRVRVVAGEVLELRMKGPAGAAFGILKGSASPACNGHPYGSIADIQFGNALGPEKFVHAGQFDAQGNATATWPVQRLSSGELPGLQMFVMRGNQHRWPVSAAFYLLER